MILTLFFVAVFSANCNANAQQIHVINVVNEIDGAALPSDCLPLATANAQCNFRSAWEACKSIPLEEYCDIHLPALVAIDVAHGPVVLSQQNIRIVGNGATVYQDGTAPGNALIDSFSTGSLQLTNSAQQDYAERCVYACPGDSYRFSSCAYDNNEDTYFRLYNGNTEVTSNDEACGHASEISYKYSGYGCTELCLRVGCYQDDACTTTVDIYKEMHPRFIEYSQRNASTSAIPQLTLSDFIVLGFGSYEADGGALHVEGPVALVLQSMTFDSNIGRFGGAVWMNNNAAGLSINDCHFLSCNTWNGGALSIYENNRDVTITTTEFLNCQSSGDGGGLHVGNSNDHIQVTDTTFTGCMANNGGGIEFNAWNEHITLRTLVFGSCSATNGGAMYILGENKHIDVSEVTFASCSALGQGGAVMVHDENRHLAFTDIVTTGGSATAGGGFYVYLNNSFVSFTNAMFTDCATSSGGGGVSVENYNRHIFFTDTRFERCTTGAGNGGGAVAVGTGNTHIEFTGMEFFDCAADFGGAVLLYQANEVVAFTDVEVSGCVVNSYGGGLYIAYSNAHVNVNNAYFHDNRANSGGLGGAVMMSYYNNDVELANVTIERCYADYGAGMYVSDYNFDMTVHNCVFADNVAAISGGGILSYSTNQNLLMTETVFRNCVAEKTDGGAIYSFYGNENSHFNNVLVSNCSAGGYGGGFYVDSGNIHTLFTNMVFENCTAGVRGGGLYFYSNNFVTVSNTVMRNCKATRGGGFYLEIINYNLLVSKVTIDRCTATKGGGMYLTKGNENIQIVDSTLVNCEATMGGGMYVDTVNNHLSIYGSTIKNCSAVEGAGVYSGGNMDVTFFRSHIHDNAAQVKGGGVSLGADNERVIFFECVLHHNHAVDVGGAIFSSAATVQLAIAGSLLESNTADGSGGALSIQGGNRNLLITDSASGLLSEVLETPHPYQYSPIIYERHVENSDAVEFILQFDPQTKTGPPDTIFIYGPSDGTSTYGPVLFQADNSGGYPGVDMPCLRIAPNFTVVMYGHYDFYTPPVSVADNIYGFKLYITPVLPNPLSPTIFSHNQAGQRGGGVYMFSSTEFAVVVNTHFEYNIAKGGGGAMYLRNAMTGFIMESSVFTENESDEDGGAVVVSSASYGWVLDHCEFYGNRAKGDGGAISLVTNNGVDGGLVLGNQMSIVDCDFAGNTAERGGAIFADKENDLALSGCTVRNNTASGSGGGLMVSTLNLVTLQDTTFDSNEAGECGGAVASLHGNLFTVRDLTAVKNSAGTIGGAMCYLDYTETDLSGENLISGNTAGQVGGAIASIASPLWTLAAEGSMALQENSAQRGSALYFRHLLQVYGRALHGLSFERNTAVVGGTVYWTYDSVMTEEPFGLSNASLVWKDNVAPYGAKYATQAVRVQGPTTYEATVYGISLSPPLEFSLSDFYNQEMPIGGPTTVFVSILDAHAEQCNNRFPYLSGTGIEETVSDGTAVFDALEAQCTPEGAITLKFEARLNDLAEITDATRTSYHIANYTDVTFRSCGSGEYIKDGMCTTCPDGTYSFKTTVTEQTECQDCSTKNGVDTCYADQIVTKSGYWRRFDDSVMVLDCFNDVNGCQGGNGTGDTLCGEGYRGALCAVCADGYFLDGPQCSKCGEEKGLSPVTAFYVAIVGFGFVVFVFFFYTKCIDTSDAAITKEKMEDLMHQVDEEHGDAHSEIDSSIAESFYVPKVSLHEKVKAWFQKEYNTIRVKLKIVITTYQILSSIPTTTQVKFPGTFAKFLAAFDVFNLNIVSAIPFGCAQTFTFIDKLIFTTLSPMILSLLLLLLFVCDVIWQVRHPFKLNGDEAKIKKLSTLKNKYLTYFFFLTYLVLPSVSTTIFQTFLCTNVDPHDEDGESSDYYLTADMSISCTSDYYHRGVAYAIVMLLIYVVGIPTMYFVLLYYNREELLTRDDFPHTFEMGTQTMADDWIAGDFPDERAARRASRTQRHAMPHVLTPRAARLAFLWDAYEPKFWYWEVVETTRRLMLTAVLSICGTGTSVQSIFAVLLGLLYIKLYGFYEPYVLDNDDIIAEAGQFQIFFSFLGALIYQKSLLGSDWNIYVSVALIMINLVVAVIFVYYGFQTLADEIQSNGMEEKVEPVVVPAIPVEHHHSRKMHSRQDELNDEDQWLQSHPYKDLEPFDEPNFSADIGTYCDFNDLSKSQDEANTSPDQHETKEEPSSMSPTRPVPSITAPTSPNKEPKMHEFLIQSLRASLQEKSQALAQATYKAEMQLREKEEKEHSHKLEVAQREQKIQELQQLVDQLKEHTHVS